MKPTQTTTPDTPSAVEKTNSEQAKPEPPKTSQKDEEIGGPKGPEPTRFGDWEQKGRCSDF